MASKPQIISNSQPHTVSLPAGSTVAARKAPRKPPAPEVQDIEPTEVRLDPDAPATAAAPRPAPKAPAKAAPKAAPKAEKRKPAAPVAPPAPAPAVAQVGFGADIMQRLQGLRQRNDEVRAALDQLPVATGATR